MKTLITKPQAGLSGSEKKSSVITAQAVLHSNLPQDKTMKKLTKQPRLIMLLQFLIIHCALLIATADATIRYVSPHGSNEPPYTSWSTASHSIQTCIDISSSGDTIYVGNGVYVEQVVVHRGITLIGSGADSCIIDTRTLATPSDFYAVTVRDSCIFKNFKVIVSNFYPPSNTWWGIGIYLFDITLPDYHTYIQFNKIEQCRRGIATSTSNAKIKYNIISETNHGIFLSAVITGIYPEVTHNIISAGICIFINFGTTPFIVNNICEGYRAFWGSYSGLNEIYNNLWIVNDGLYHSDSTKLYNNVITGNPLIAIQPGPNNSIKNNVIENAEEVMKATFPMTPIFKFNNVWNSAYVYHNVPPPDTTNMFADPMFVNPDSMDFKLQMYSPLIDAGDPNILDVDGSRSDIGLFGGPYGQKYTYQDLAPKPPRNVNAVIDSGFVKLTWDRNTEADFSHYHIFRDTVPDFMYDSTKIIAALSDTVYFDNPPQKYISGNYYYKLTALDFTRNQSAPSEEVHVNITGIPEAPPLVVEHYKLLHNYPNPFNSSTMIPYRLKAPGYVKLYVYDIKGELLKVLVNQYQNAGYYEVMFSPTREERRRGEFDKGNGWWTGYNNDIATGIYLYKIMVLGEGDIPVFSDMGKMILLK